MGKHERRIRVIKVMILTMIGLILVFLVESSSSVSSVFASFAPDSVVDHAGCRLVNTVGDEGLRQEVCITSYLTVTYPFSAYLPLIRSYRAPSGIYGYVTDNGLPAAGMHVVLRRSGYAISGTDTLSDGGFSFAGVPSLAAGQYYKVFINDNLYSNHHLDWTSRQLISYTAGSNVHIGDFEVARLDLLTPTMGVTVTLPYTFYWVPRPMVPSDNYQFYLTDGDNRYYSGPLGYVSSFSLTTFPPGLSCTSYGCAWGVYLPGTDGSDAYSELRVINFSITGLQQSLHSR